MKPLTAPREDAVAIPAPPRPRKWLNRNVVGMGLTSLLNDVGHESATAVLPAFLSTIGASATALGVMLPAIFSPEYPPGLLLLSGAGRSSCSGG
jgi:hypothetical protein